MKVSRKNGLDDAIERNRILIGEEKRKDCPTSRNIDTSKEPLKKGVHKEKVQ